MPAYRRLHVPGGTYFFTANLADRSRCLLVEHVAALRESWRDVERDHPFSTLAAVVLPDHLHVIWTLPPDDADFSTRLRLLKSGFTRRLRVSGVIVSELRQRRVPAPRPAPPATPDVVDITTASSSSSGK